MRRPVSPSAIARAFERRDRLEAQLRQVDAVIAEAGRAYSFSQGYRVPLRVEALRNAVGAGARR